LRRRPGGRTSQAERRGPTAARSNSGDPAGRDRRQIDRYWEATMQRFKFPMSAEDRKFARRAGRIALIIYTSTALALTAAIVGFSASNALAPNHQVTAK
jgi:hypothetical protein